MFATNIELLLETFQYFKVFIGVTSSHNGENPIECVNSDENLCDVVDKKVEKGCESLLTKTKIRIQ